MVDRNVSKEELAGRTARLRQRFPTVDDLRRRARRRVPRFGFDFVDGGATEEYCIRRNTDAFQAIELLPRYCVDSKGARPRSSCSAGAMRPRSGSPRWARPD